MRRHFTANTIPSLLSGTEESLCSKSTTRFLNLSLPLQGMYAAMRQLKSAALNSGEPRRRTNETGTTSRDPPHLRRHRLATSRLPDYALGHDARAREPQPVAAHLGPRHLDWQRTRDPAASWAECAAHAAQL